MAILNPVRSQSTKDTGATVREQLSYCSGSLLDLHAKTSCGFIPVSFTDHESRAFSITILLEDLKYQLLTYKAQSTEVMLIYRFN